MEGMKSSLTIKDVLSRLEAQFAFHQKRAGFHAEQEEHHRAQRELHTGEMETISRHLDAFRTSSEGATDLARRATVPVAEAHEPLDTGRRGLLSRLGGLLLDEKEADERFGIAAMTEELNRRFGDVLRPPADSRQVSVLLRRFARQGRIRQVRRGRPHYEALYVRGK
jgi:hypothetical protein